MCGPRDVPEGSASSRKTQARFSWTGVAAMRFFKRGKETTFVPPPGMAPPPGSKEPDVKSVPLAQVLTPLRGMSWRSKKASPREGKGTPRRKEPTLGGSSDSLVPDDPLAASIISQEQLTRSKKKIESPDLTDLHTVAPKMPVLEKGVETLNERITTLEGIFQSILMFLSY